MGGNPTRHVTIIIQQKPFISTEVIKKCHTIDKYISNIICLIFKMIGSYL